MKLLYYCRSGYEADLLAELEHHFAKLGAQGKYGYAQFRKGDAHIIFNLPQDEISKKKVSTLSDNEQELRQFLVPFNHLIFARQQVLVLNEIEFTTQDRISEVIEALKEYEGLSFSDVHVDYPDTEEGKKIAKFCKKFAVPLRSKLRKESYLQAHKKNQQADRALSIGDFSSEKLSSPDILSEGKPAQNIKDMKGKERSDNSSRLLLHLFFKESGACVLGVSYPQINRFVSRSNEPLGIKRLKFPNDAPSRSTLKLEEAIKLFFNKEQEKELFNAGMRACDLGACPGGWTYQLVQRQLTVEAIDHGKMADNLMKTGKVEYYSEDGFLYQPKQANVDWLVCDMIEQPNRVAKLMLDWLLSGKANAALFNLKLPMNKRFRVIYPIIENIEQKLKDTFGDYELQAKHLYHNRDEITLVIIVNSQLINAYRKYSKMTS